MYLLFVENDFMSSEELQELISKSPVDSDVVNCYSEQTLLKVAKKLSPEIVIVDLKLVGDQMEELFTSLRDNASNAYILTLVDKDYYEKLHRVIEVGGVDDYLVKPINKGDFLARVQIAIKRKKFEYTDQPDISSEHKTEDLKPPSREPALEPDIYGNETKKEDPFMSLDDQTQSSGDDFDFFSTDESEDEVKPEPKEDKEPPSPYDESDIEPVALDIEKEILPSSPYSDITGPGKEMSKDDSHITVEPLAEFTDEVFFDGTSGGQSKEVSQDYKPAGESIDDFLSPHDQDSRMTPPDSSTGPGSDFNNFNDSLQKPQQKEEDWGTPETDLFEKEPDLSQFKQTMPEDIKHSQEPPVARQEDTAKKEYQDPYFDDLLDEGFNQFDEKGSESTGASQQQSQVPPLSKRDSGEEIQFDRIEPKEDVGKYFPGVGELKPRQKEAPKRKRPEYDQDVLDDFVREDDLAEIDGRGGKPELQGFKKVLSIAGNVAFVFLLLLIASLSFFLIQTRLTGDVPRIGDYQIRTVDFDTMEPAFGSGSLIMVRDETNPLFFRERDIITYRDPTAIDSLITHRIVEVHHDARGINFITRGDAYTEDQPNDPNPVYAEDIVGVVDRYVPYIGYLFDFVLTREGTILLIFVPCVLIIAYELMKIFKHISSSGKKKRSRSKKHGRYAEGFDE